MKDISVYHDAKYQDAKYSRIRNGIYQLGDEYFTSLSFVQETAFGEGEDSSRISQYPLEDILDCFGVYVSDFYERLNHGGSNTCYLEFAGSSLDNIQKLLGLVGRHVYIKRQKEGNACFEKLCIE